MAKRSLDQQNKSKIHNKFIGYNVETFKYHKFSIYTGWTSWSRGSVFDLEQCKTKESQVRIPFATIKLYIFNNSTQLKFKFQFKKMDNGCNASKIKFLSILFFWSNSYKNMNPTCSLHACRINGQPIKIGFDCMFRCIIHTYSVLMIFHWKIGYMQVDRSLCPLFAEKTKSPAMLILISKLVRIGETIESRHFSATYYSFN